MKKMRIAIYMRLSKEDVDSGTTDESNSITNQRFLLKKYAAEHFEQYSLMEFYDDGYSGVNFQRPGVGALLDSVKKDEIDCIIVKDFSRFSRDYIELGSYLDRIFPFLGIRFISVNDHYDSINYKGNVSELDTSFRSLMYDLYSKDLSVKVKSALHARKKQGLYISAVAPFGYRKAPDDRHMLLIEEDEAQVVRRIFKMSEGGKTSSEIAKCLNAEQVKTPLQFRMDKGEVKRKEKRLQWSGSGICAILRNRVYTGDMESLKFEKNEVGGKNHIKPKREWKTYYDHHEPIIDRETFDRIQDRKRICGNRKKERQHSALPYQKRHPLTGKIICGGCGKSMALRKESVNPYFYCSYRYVNEQESCVGKVNLMFLEQYVLFMLQGELSRQKKIEMMKKQQKDCVRQQIQELEKAKQEWNTRKKSLQKKYVEDYQKYALEKAEKFISQTEKIQQTEEKILEVENKIEKLRVKFPEYGEGEADGSVGNLQLELTKEVVEQYIKRILVYDEMHMEVEWKFE